MKKDEPKTPGLYEVYAARANADLSQCQVFHNELIAWDDEDALRRLREMTGGLYFDFNVRRIMDVRV